MTIRKLCDICQSDKVVTDILFGNEIKIKITSWQPYEGGLRCGHCTHCMRGMDYCNKTRSYQDICADCIVKIITGKKVV